MVISALEISTGEIFQVTVLLPVKFSLLAVRVRVYLPGSLASVVPETV